MTTNFDTRLASYSSPVLSIFRIIFGVLFALHGSMKLFGWPLGTSIPVGTWPGWWAGLIEFVTGVLIALGLFTRIAAFIASGHMAVAYFWMHWPPLEGPSGSFWPFDQQMGGNGGELAILYCFAFLLLATTGAGTLSVDGRRRAGIGRTTAVRTSEPVARGGLLSRWRRR
ncbi:DoxX family protein [Mycolicibacterium boenickei]